MEAHTGASTLDQILTGAAIYTIFVIVLLLMTDVLQWQAQASGGWLLSILNSHRNTKQHYSSSMSSGIQPGITKYYRHVMKDYLIELLKHMVVLWESVPMYTLI